MGEFGTDLLQKSMVSSPPQQSESSVGSDLGTGSQCCLPEKLVT